MIDARCPGCGLDGPQIDRDALPGLLGENAEYWANALGGAAPASDPGRWTTLEYACHLRDVHRLFDGRLRQMLDEDDPAFGSWDQDRAAIDGRYAEADASRVAEELVAAARSVGTTYAGVRGAQWQRTGRRDDGSRFTVETLGRYHLHEAVHHLWDVDPSRATVAAYDADARAYREATAALPETVRIQIERFVAAVGSGARVLEVGSGGGRDASALEERGIRVRRTDITPAFVELLRADGHEADVLDPLRDDLTDPARPGTPYDGIWAAASLLHVARAELPTVLARLAGATRPDGVLHLALKEGDGEGWSRHGCVAAPRHFTYWREAPLRTVLDEAGWEVQELGTGTSPRGDGWLDLIARRR